MNIVKKSPVFRPRIDHSRLRDRRREFPTFAHLIRAVTGFDFSVTQNVKSWSRAKYNRNYERTKGAILCTGVPLRHVNDWDAGVNNLKVSANLASRSRMTLIYLDFDCHGSGDPRDAKKLCELVQDKLPHGDVLVSDRGASAWVLVDVSERLLNSREYNALVEKIEIYARGVAAANDLSLSGVEVKGRVPEWNSRGRIERCADMLKCPKTGLNVGEPVKLSTLLVTDWTPPSAPPKAKAKLRSGSRKLLGLSTAQSNGINHVVSLVRDWFPDRPTRTRNDRLITDLRFAEALLVIANLQPNEDGSLPHRFAEAVWKQWHAEGLLSYGWVSEVWQTIRDFLSQSGYLYSEDNGRYVRPVRSITGEVEVKGQAARWCMLEWLRSHIKATAEHGSIWDDVASTDERGLTAVHTQGGDLVHTSLSLDRGPVSRPWTIHSDWGVRPLSQIPRKDWERLERLLAV